MNEFIQSLEAEAPIPFKKWLEITVAQEKADKEGKLIRTVVEEYGMEDQDWYNGRDWWENHYQTNTAKMKMDCGKVSDKFRIKFGLSPIDFDENGVDLDIAIPNKIKKMIIVGDSGNVINYLHKTFPDHIDDVDYLDRFMDIATDNLAEKKNRKAVRKLLEIRYDYRDEDEDKQEWIESEMDMLIDDTPVEESSDEEFEGSLFKWQDHISTVQKLIMKGTGVVGVVMFIVGINLTVRGHGDIGGWLSGIGMFIAVQLFWALGKLYSFIEKKFPAKLKQWGYSRIFWFLLLAAYLMDGLGILGVGTLVSDNLPETLSEVVNLVGEIL